MCRLLLAVTLLDGPRNLFYFTTTGPALGGRFTAWQMYRHPVSLHAGQKSTPTLSHRAQRLGGIQRFVRISKQFTGVTPSARHSPIHSIFIHNYLSSSYAPQCQGTMLNETDKVPALREFTVHPGRQTRTKLRRSIMPEMTTPPRGVGRGPWVETGCRDIQLVESPCSEHWAPGYVRVLSHVAHRGTL